jgi:hypothetical protein
MITYIKHKNIDFNAWDNCIRNSMNPVIYAYSWYLEASCECWDALIEGNYERVMPLPVRRKLGIQYVYPPLMTQQLGIFSKEEITEKKANEFVEAIPSGIKYAEIKFNTGNSLSVKNGIKIIRHNNYELNLNLPYQEIIKDYTANHVRNIKRRALHEISIKKSLDMESLITLFKQEKETKISKLPDDYFSYLHKLFKALVAQDKASIFEVYQGDKYCGASLIASDSDRIYFLFSAINAEGKKYGLMHKLINHIIQLHAGTEFTFDFEGSDNANLARFYSGFGATLTHYYELKINRLPKLITKLRRIISIK